MARTALEERVRRRIKAQQSLYSLSNSDMALKMHMSLQAWERRLNQPGKLTLEEMHRIDTVLKTKLMEAI